MKSLPLSLAITVFLLFHTISYGQKADSVEKWSFHFQQTVVTQYHGSITSPYSGMRSLSAEAETKTSLTSTLFLGMRTWKNGALYFNPEISGGEGFSEVNGIAGFPNGEIYRVGNPKPTAYVARIYLEHIFNLGNGKQTVDPDANQLAGTVDSSSLRIVAGKFSLPDFFDEHAYSHDPRTQFLNWSLMSNGAWDYPANTRGYTWGFMAEWAKKTFTIRFAVVLEPKEANGSELDLNISKAHGTSIEFEKPYTIKGRHGRLRVFGFNNNANMGNYNQSIALNPEAPDITATREYGHNKYGFGLNIEQSLGENLGLFLRASWNDGHNETWAFTEIDRTVSLGLLFNGSSWKRPGDRFGIAFAANGISKDHQDYLAAGGYGFIIGDGQLANYGYESIFETYYSFQLVKTFYISPDYQFVVNPAYNKDRGPVNIIGLRAHFEL